MELQRDDIKDKIHTVRGLKVMLDKDLAELYGVLPIRLREQVKRNIARFPEDFMFRLVEKEVENMVSQNAIPSKQHLGGYLPYAFTEQGVATLSGILKSKRAIEVNIQIMRAFVSMRKFISKNIELFSRLDCVERKQLEYQMKTDKRFERVFDAIENKQVKQGIFFEGQVFDAYRFVCDLIRSAKKSIILIDNYVDDSVLTLLGKRGNQVNATVYTKITRQLELDLRKYNSQYHEIIIKEFSKSHDRFLIIDENTVYHIGASLKDLGKKWFAFSKFEKKAMKIVAELI